MTRFFKLLIAIALLLPIGIYPIAAAADTAPIIAAASSMKFALEDIASAFRQDTGRSVRFSFASSGNLVRQIRQGAPFEVFLSANSNFVYELERLGLIQGEPKVYALGRLVLLAESNSQLALDEQLHGIRQALENGRLKRFAIASPKHAPYGLAARQALQHGGLWKGIQSALVIGEDVTQAAHFALSGAAQAGLISYSLTLTPALQDKISYVLIPTDFHQPLQQTIVLLNQAGATARQFCQYIMSNKARMILSRYGYTTP